MVQESVQVKHALELRGFGVGFGQRVVLAEMDLVLPSRGIDVLMGPVKTGKSTLFRTLAGLYQGHPLHREWGHIWMKGQPIQGACRPALVQQHARALDQPIWQVLCEQIRSERSLSPVAWRDWAVNELMQNNLPDVVERIDQPLLVAGPRMQRAVMALAHAVAEPDLLMLDEPTFGLSDSDATWMVEWLCQLGTQCRLWVSMHHQQQARKMADRIVLIGGGRVLAHVQSDEFTAQYDHEWVSHFCRTGSLPLAAPDALPHELAEGVAPPAPLPKEATETGVSLPTRQCTLQAVEVATQSASISALAPERAAVFLPVALPPPSLTGVELAATVGQVMLSDSRGPQGFRWVVPGVLAGCPAPGNVAPLDYDLDLLARAGVTHLVTLTEKDLDQDALRRHHLANIHLPILDCEAPSLNQMHMLMVRMQRLMEAHHVLAVHCKAGLGRTGVVLAAWLIREGGLSAEAAVERVRKVQPGYIQSDEQLAFLHSYEVDILRRMR